MTEISTGDEFLKPPAHLTAKVAEVTGGGERRVVEGGPAQDPHHARIHHVLPAQYLEYRRLAYHTDNEAAAAAAPNQHRNGREKRRRGTVEKRG